MAHTGSLQRRRPVHTPALVTDDSDDAGQSVTQPQPEKRPQSDHQTTRGDALAVTRSAEAADPASDADLRNRRIASFLRQIYRALTGPTVVLLAALIGGVLLLYVYAQALAVVATIASLPAWLSVPATIGLAVLVGMVVYALVRIGWLYTRLRSNRQLRFPDLDRLADHRRLQSRLRQSGRQRAMRQIRNRLTPYVRDYQSRRLRTRPLADGDSPSSPGSIDTSANTGLLAEGEIKAIDQTRRRLIDRNRVEDDPHWVQLYRDRFQAPLDAAAKSRVQQCARYVAWKTAISPNPLVDTLITLYWSFQMFRDLCVIYNLRVGTVGTAALLCRVFFNAYVAGQLDEFEEHVESGVDGLVDGLPDIAKTVVGKVASKGAAGFANYILIRRLGTRAIRMLQPLATSS